MEKLEEALRPVFDLLGFSFSQQFDPEVKPLSFLRALREKAIPGDEAGIIKPTRLHPYLFSFFGIFSSLSLSSFFMRTCALVCLSDCVTPSSN